MRRPRAALTACRRGSSQTDDLWAAASAQQPLPAVPLCPARYVGRDAAKELIREEEEKRAASSGGNSGDERGGDHSSGGERDGDDSSGGSIDADAAAAAEG